MAEFRGRKPSVNEVSNTNAPRSRISRLLASTAICALAASGVLTALTEPAGAQEPYDEDLITYHTGALSLGKTDGADANLDNSKDINLTEIRVGTAMGAQAISVYAHGSQALHKPGGPAGNIIIKQSGDLSSSNLADDTIAGTSAVLRAISVGGEGNGADHREKRKAGNGGSGGDITITNSGAIVSDVKKTYAIHAISYGGIGGYQDTESNKYPAGLGGKGGRVTLINSNDVTSNRSDAAAIVLQSLGGPSGRDETHSDLKSGGAVSLILKALESGGQSVVSTKGDRSAGVVAQSVGGGDITYDLSNGAPRPVSGGNGGAVTIDIGGNKLSTSGALSHGIIGQSIGGSSGLSPKGKAGSHGGDASSVSVTTGSGAKITTQGLNSDGILLQSIGGSGGTGGFDTGSVAVGGNGGDGGHGGTLNVKMHGSIQTAGDHSLGVLTQSIGGGGGRGGNADAKGSFTALAIGGDGGNGGNGGNISITVADIVTEGLFSHATSALSIGGGGGHGGTATARATAPIFASATAIGGSGGKGGHGGKIDLSIDGNVKTSGDHSFGAMASSIGGGGGSGGAAHALSAAAGPVSLAVSVSLGGHAGSGGDGKGTSINQSLDSTIATEGAFSVGMAASSIGGGGGSGGGAQSIAASVAAGEGAISGSVSVAIGGKGGGGGDGGSVSLGSKGKILTKSDFALGVHGLSVGGGGGHGGSSTSLSAALSTGMSAAVSVGIGGKGGDGGHGGKVEVTLADDHAQISTEGEHASAVVAQSIGGGGGTGGSSLSLAASLGAEKNGNAISVGIGGSGGKGGNGGEVDIDSGASLATKGSMSHAMLVQSIGGGGGSGGNALSVSASLGAKAARSLSASIGGNGKSAGHGGDVDVAARGPIKVEGQFSIGIAAHSIGGSGGIGGNSQSASAAIKTSRDKNGGTKKPGGKAVTVSVGGNGGDGGDGGSVTILSEAALTTSGDVGIGIMAQSVGGGGGAGGHADSIFLTGSSKTPVDDSGSGFSLEHLASLQLALGGTGGKGGDGGTVDVTQKYSRISTGGDGAAGILAQSIGGGGGLTAAADHLTFLKLAELGGHNTAGHGSTVKVGTEYEIDTAGLFASGIIAQSIGGGGGALLSSENLRERFLEANDLHSKIGEVTTGGFLTSGKGGKVEIQSGGDISTSGSFAAGIIAQSIGGGGGLSTIDNADSRTYATVASELDTKSTSENGAETVSINQSGQISTDGKSAIGIVAQSIGGGGGLIQAASEIIDETNASRINANLNKHNGGGDGGDVTITQTSGAGISTNGDGGMGIFAQSIGGSGGLIQKSDGSFTVHNLDTAGAGGDITIRQNGILTTNGRFAHGIYANTYGVSKPGDIDLTIDGKVQTNGHDVDAVVATAGAVEHRSGAIKISIGKSGRVISEGDDADAVVINDTTSGFLSVAEISNSGLISSNDGLAIRSNQNTVIANNGIIKGGIDLTAERTSFPPFAKHPVKVTSSGALSNSSSGIIESAVELDLGIYAGNHLFYDQHVGLFSNAGTLSPGGSGSITRTELSGRYESSDTAVYAVDLDLSLGDSDEFITSQGAFVKGSVRPEIIAFGANREFTIFSTPKTQDMRLSAKTVDTPVVKYSLAKDTSDHGDHTVDIKVEDIDFVADGLNSNQIAIAKNLNARLAGGTENADVDLLALANATTLTEYTHLLGSYSNTHSAKQKASVRGGASQFTSAAFSCGIANGENAAIAEGECDWSQAGYRWTDHSATDTAAARQDRSFNISVGAQRAVSEHWRLGLAASYGTVTSTSGLAHSQIELGQVGMVAKYQKDNFLLGGSITAGYGWQDTIRGIALRPGTSASSAADHIWIHGRLRAAFLAESDAGYLKPRVDLDFNYIHSGGYTESGAGVHNLTVLSNDDFQVSVAAGLEFGTSFELTPELSVRAYGYGGVRFLPDNSTTTQVLLAGAEDALQHRSFEDSYLGEVSAGLKFFGQQQFGLDIRYDGAFGETVQSHAISGKLRWGF